MSFEEQAIDRMRIEDLAKRYAHGIDARDWPAVDSCFAPTAQVHGTQFSGPYPEYIASLRKAVESFRTTMHFFGNQLAEISGDKGTLTTYGIAFHLGKEGGGDFVIGVRYDDEVARTGEAWLIQRRAVQGIWRRALGAEIQDLTGA
jgi:hypothetical protein